MGMQWGHHHEDESNDQSKVLSECSPWWRCLESTQLDPSNEHKQAWRKHPAFFEVKPKKRAWGASSWFSGPMNDKTSLYLKMSAMELVTFISQYTVYGLSLCAPYILSGVFATKIEDANWSKLLLWIMNEGFVGAIKASPRRICAFCSPNFVSSQITSNFETRVHLVALNSQDPPKLKRLHGPKQTLGWAPFFSDGKKRSPNCVHFRIWCGF